VSVEALGKNLTRAAMLLPPSLDRVEGLRLDRGASEEDAEPWIMKHGAGGSKDRYRREARLIYRSAKRPPLALGQVVRGFHPVDADSEAGGCHRYRPMLALKNDAAAGNVLGRAH
jgi:hypothetical protein